MKNDLWVRPWAVWVMMAGEYRELEDVWLGRTEILVVE